MKSQLALIIEDNEELAELFSMALETAKFETEIALSGDGALAWLADRVPDVVVLDLHLPRVGGGEVLRQIRDDPRLSETRVIIVTADAQGAEHYQDLADLALVKPVSIEQLVRLSARLSSAGWTGEEEAS
jgi:CheY-like chemotaxis protein